jgi:hypothetical protein
MNLKPRLEVNRLLGGRRLCFASLVSGPVTGPNLRWQMARPGGGGVDGPLCCAKSFTTREIRALDLTALLAHDSYSH